MDGAEKLDGLSQTAATVDAGALDSARFGFDRAHPHRSARRVFYITQGLAITALVSGLIWALVSAPTITFTALHFGALVLFACTIFCGSWLHPT